MPVPYPILGSGNSADLYEIFKFVNEGVGGTFMPLMLATIWIIILIGSLSEGRIASRAFIFASFVCSILAIMLSLIALLNAQYMYFLFLMLGAGVVWYQLATAPGI